MNGETIALIVIALLGILFSGAFWLRFKTLIGQIREFMDTLADAIADDNVSNTEIIAILKEAKDIATAIFNIADLFKKG